MPGNAVSVVIPVGRVDRHLADQLDAMRSQTAADWELILSLNTTDPMARTHLEALLADFEDVNVRVVDSSHKVNASHARNVAARVARGSYLLFCDADDIAEPTWIEEMENSLEDADAVGGHLDEELLTTPKQRRWRPPATPGALPTFMGQPFVLTSNMGVQRELFDAVGGFDDALHRCEDIAFSWALIDRGVELTYAPGAVIHYRHRRGVLGMVTQHFGYGRGFSQILTRRDPPGQSDQRMLPLVFRPNNAQVERWSLIHLLRRSALGAGRLAGFVESVVGRRFELPKVPT